MQRYDKEEESAPTMSTGRTSDQRANSRLNSCLPCEVHSGEVSSSAFLLNISLKGALISSRLMLQKHHPISISIKISELGESILLRGVIVRVTRGLDDFHKEIYRCGVRFGSLPAEFLPLIKKLMGRNL